MEAAAGGGLTERRRCDERWRDGSKTMTTMAATRPCDDDAGGTTKERCEMFFLLPICGMNLRVKIYVGMNGLVCG